MSKLFLFSCACKSVLREVGMGLLSPSAGFSDRTNLVRRFSYFSGRTFEIMIANINKLNLLFLAIHKFLNIGQILKLEGQVLKSCDVALCTNKLI